MDELQNGTQRQALDPISLGTSLCSMMHDQENNNKNETCNKAR